MKREAAASLLQICLREKMNEITDHNPNREPDFEPDIAYDLGSHRVTADGVIDGDSLFIEIKRDLQAFLPNIIINDQQTRTLKIQIMGASLEEENSITSHIISECKKIDPRIKDIDVRCEDFHGDVQITGSLGEELGKLGFRASENSTGLTKFSLQTFHEAIRFQIHKEEKEELTGDEAQQIADYIVPKIFSSVQSWTPGSKLTLHVFSHNTRPMHQEMVEEIFNQVFNVALQNLTIEYSVNEPPIIPNVHMNFSFAGEMFSNETNKITYESPKDADFSQINEDDSE